MTGTEIEPAPSAGEFVGDPLGCVRLHLAGAVATVTLDRADRLNAQTPHTWHALREAGRALTGDVRVVVVRAAGRAFSAGLDRAAFSPSGVPGTVGLAALAAMPPDDADGVIDGYQDGFRWLRRPDLISVAAVQGHAIGAGCQLALACDLRVLTTDAQLALPEPTLGLVPDLGGTAPLVDAVGYSRALEICLTGRRVGADEALRLGLATVVVEPGDLAAATDDLVAALLATAREPSTETKVLLQAAAQRLHTRDEQEGAERAAQLRRLRELAAGSAGS